MIHLFYPQKNLHRHCFKFLLGHLYVPGEIWNNDYAKCCGVKEVYYGICASREWTDFSILKFNLAVRLLWHKQRKLNDQVYSLLLFGSSRPHNHAESKVAHYRRINQVIPSRLNCPPLLYINLRFDWRSNNKMMYRFEQARRQTNLSAHSQGVPQLTIKTTTFHDRQLNTLVITNTCVQWKRALKV